MSVSGLPLCFSALVACLSCAVAASWPDIYLSVDSIQTLQGGTRACSSTHKARLTAVFMDAAGSRRYHPSTAAAAASAATAATASAIRLLCVWCAGALAVVTPFLSSFHSRVTVVLFTLIASFLHYSSGVFGLTRLQYPLHTDLLLQRGPAETLWKTSYMPGMAVYPEFWCSAEPNAPPRVVRGH